MSCLLFGYNKYYGIVSRIKRLSRAEPIAESCCDGIKVEIGGGETPARRDQGFLNVDLRDRHTVDVVAQAWELSGKLGENSVGYLYSRHMLEHLTYAQVSRALKDWSVAMKPGAGIELVVPNQTFHILQLLSNRIGDVEYSHGLAGFHGWQRCDKDGDFWDVHKSSFSQKHLLSILSEHFEFSRYEFLFTSSKNVHFRGVTR